MTTPKSKAVASARWIAVFPAAILAAWAGYVFAAYVLRTFLMGWWLSPDSLPAQIVTVVVGSVFMGVAYMLVVAYILPARRTATVTLCTVGVAICAIFSVISVALADWWALANFLVGGAACGYTGYALIANIPKDIRANHPDQTVPEREVVPIDMRSPSDMADFIDCVVAFPAAVDEMRRSNDITTIPERMAKHTHEAFRRIEADVTRNRLAASVAPDQLYRYIVKLSMMDQYTYAYVSTAIKPLFELLAECGVQVYYIVDNTLRDDRLRAVVQLFDLAGITVVTPTINGSDWRALSSKIKARLEAGTHVAYIEADASVNYLDAAQQLAAEHPCVTTFRNRAPDDASISVLSLGKAPG